MEEQKTWTSEEAMSNLESLTKLKWSREELPDGVRELLQTYETAIPEMAAEIRSLRGELRENQRKENKSEESSSADSSTTGYDDLAELAKRLGLDQQ